MLHVEAETDPPRRPPRRRRDVEIPLHAVAPELIEVQETREGRLAGEQAGRWVVRGLTERQLEVVKMVFAGKPRAEIREALGMSSGALTRTLARITEKFRSRAARISRKVAVELYLAEARRRLYRPPRCCRKGREACWHTGICPFV
jgi:DNA-binding CsgD family transcriptional regulator